MTSCYRLLSRDRYEEAKASLQRLRKSHTEAEINHEIQALRYAHSTAHKGTWSEVFNKDNRKRTTVAVLAMFGQQITGQAFSSQYSVIFYQTQGFKSQAFLFNILSNVSSLVCLIATWFIIDQVGRRPMLIIGGSGMAIFLFIVGGLGAVPSPTNTEKQALVSVDSGREVIRSVHTNSFQVASFILFSSAYSLSWAPV